ncbi:hypothetical protein GCM10023264_24920 [Sphingomonas daechungensis]
MWGRVLIPGAILCAALASPAVAAPGSATTTVTVKASVVKPLVLTAKQDLDLGTIVLNNGTWSGVTISVSQAGVRTCVSANVTCSGTAQAAKFNIVGSNNNVARISAPNVTLVNQADSTKTLVMTLSAPATVAIPNSGQPGVDFSVGGSITVNSTTTGGLYSGTMNVTVDYQ